MACTRGVYWPYWAGGYYLDDGVFFFLGTYADSPRSLAIEILCRYMYM